MVSYQHDGVVLRPPVTCGTESEAARRACAALSRACSDALGYEQPVTVKEMVAGSANKDKVRPRRSRSKAANWFSQISRYLDNWHHLAP